MSSDYFSAWDEQKRKKQKTTTKTVIFKFADAVGRRLEIQWCV